MKKGFDSSGKEVIGRFAFITIKWFTGNWFREYNNDVKPLVQISVKFIYLKHILIIGFGLLGMFFAFLSSQTFKPRPIISIEKKTGKKENGFILLLLQRVG